MALYIPPQPTRTYNQPCAILPARTYQEPREGKCFIPVQIAWDGTTKTQLVNVQGLTTQTFSQIVMLDVDNSRSGAPVVFYFPDSLDILEVAPGSSGLFPVFTNQLQVYVSSPEALAIDVTSFRILNYQQPPIALPPPQYTNIISAGNIITDTTTVLLPPSASGTLIGYSVYASLAANVGASSVWEFLLSDTAAGTIIDRAVIQITKDTVHNGPIMNVSDIAYRFAGGLTCTTLTTVSVLAGQNTAVSLRYRTP